MQFLPQMRLIVDDVAQACVHPQCTRSGIQVDGICTTVDESILGRSSQGGTDSEPSGGPVDIDALNPAFKAVRIGRIGQASIDDRGRRAHGRGDRDCEESRLRRHDSVDLLLQLRAIDRLPIASIASGPVSLTGGKKIPTQCQHGLDIGTGRPSYRDRRASDARR